MVREVPALRVVDGHVRGDGRDRAGPVVERPGAEPGQRPPGVHTRGRDDGHRRLGETGHRESHADVSHHLPRDVVAEAHPEDRASTHDLEDLGSRGGHHVGTPP